MTRLSTHEQIVVMQAFVDGKAVEFKDSRGNWGDASTPSWNWGGTDFRIKVEPKEVWVTYDKNGCLSSPSFNTSAAAELYIKEESWRFNYTIHRMVEDTSCDI